eukprot:4742794-Amphidinium_carterae.2
MSESADKEYKRSVRWYCKASRQNFVQPQWMRSVWGPLTGGGASSDEPQASICLRLHCAKVLKRQRSQIPKPMFPGFPQNVTCGMYCIVCRHRVLAREGARGSSVSTGLRFSLRGSCLVHCFCRQEHDQ